MFPSNLQIHCGGYGTTFGVTHALGFSTGGLVIARNNKIRDEILYISGRTFTPASVCAEPRIHQGRTISEQEICQGSDKDKETWGDVMIRGLWDLQVESIIDFKLCNTDADSFYYEPMSELLSRWETIKKDKHSKQCSDQRKHFLPFVLSVNGIIGRESLAVLVQLSQTIAAKR